MKLLTFAANGGVTYGAMVDGGIVDLGARLGGTYADLRAVLEAGALARLREALAGAAADHAADAVEYLPVIPNPRKILCIGLNYESHRQETGREKTQHPTVFTRFADTQVGHRRPIRLPRVSTALDYEGELAVVIGKGGRYIAKDAALDHVAGYSCYNDASVRDWQRHTGQFTPGKNFPDTGGFGPQLVTTDEIDDVHRLGIRTRLNGAVVQDSDTSRLVFDIPTIIHYISAFTPLSPGDVIATGTPGGVGASRQPPLFMKPGDEVSVEIGLVGTLVNPIAAET